MMGTLRCLGLMFLGLGLAASGWSRNVEAQAQLTDETQTISQKHSKRNKAEPSPGRQIANGTGNIAGGAGKGAGSLAKGTGKGAVDLVTLHPINAGSSIGKGAVGAGKDVTVGTVKGTGKIAKGVGRGIKHVL
ncbi:MAG: hypothetical protein JOY54_13865 [Acidobacteriaceae bacterium]|nr:hypothetical protein [Acidobacteriaceae bacterium]